MRLPLLDTRSTSRFSLVAALILASGCSGQNTTTYESELLTQPIPQNPAEALFARMERTLLSTPLVRIRAYTTSAGTMESQFDVDIIVTPDNKARFAVKGRIGLHTPEFIYMSDGVGTTARGLTPEHLTEAVIVGAARMGVYYNVFQIKSTGTPAKADGGVAEWLRVEDFEFGEAPESGTRLLYKYYAGDEETGTVELLLDENLMPKERIQVVKSEKEFVQIREVYEVKVGTEARRDEFDPRDTPPPGMPLGRRHRGLPPR